jgi:hypothetical protein
LGDVIERVEKSGRDDSLNIYTPDRGPGRCESLESKTKNRATWSKPENAIALSTQPSNKEDFPQSDGRTEVPVCPLAFNLFS